MYENISCEFESTKISCSIVDQLAAFSPFIISGYYNVICVQCTLYTVHIRAHRTPASTLSNLQCNLNYYYYSTNCMLEVGIKWNQKKKEWTNNDCVPEIKGIWYMKHVSKYSVVVRVQRPNKKWWKIVCCCSVLNKFCGKKLNFLNGNPSGNLCYVLHWFSISLRCAMCIVGYSNEKILHFSLNWLKKTLRANFEWKTIFELHFETPE